MNLLKNLLSLTLAVSGFTMSTQAQVIYSEDFQGLNGVAPVGMTLINNDGLTPNAAVAYVSDAWVIRDELLPPNTDTCAISTSWYAPAGTSDDWIITPLVNAITATTELSWEALAPDAAYSDGYEVWVSTTAPTVAGMTAGTMVFTIAGEAQVWTSHLVSLAAFAGQNVYIGFRNNSTDKFILQLDDIVVENIIPFTSDMSVVSSIHQYTLIPESQATTEACEASVSNPASSDVTDVIVNCNVYLAPNLTTPLQTLTSPATTVAAGTAAPVACGNYTYPAGVGTYVFEYIVSSVLFTDANAVNDTLYAQVTVDAQLYARDNGQVSNSIGVGAGASANLGNNFVINTAGILDSVTYVTSGINASSSLAIGDTTQVNVYATAAGVPTGTPIASSEYYIYTAADTTAFITLTLAVNGITGYSIAPGEYNIAVTEFVTTDNGGIAVASGLFTPNKIYGQIGVGVGAWTPLEGLGFSNPVIVRPHLVVGCTATPPTAATTVSATVSCNGSADGEATTVPTGGAAPYAYQWSPTAGGQATAIATGLTAGTYWVTVVDNASCIVTDSVVITEPTAVVAAAVDNANGSATASATGGTVAATYMYMWDAAAGSQATATATGLVNGTYTVFITDDNGCMDSVTLTTTIVGVNVIEGANGLKMFPNPTSANVSIDLALTSANEVNIRIANVTGQIVLENNLGTIEATRVELNTSTLPTGVYMVHFNIGTETMTRKLVVNRR